MEFLDLKHSDFANRVFCMLEYMRGWHVSGSCDFEAYVVSVWNICTLDTDEFRDFVFELYDADESGYLDREEALDLVVDITTEAFAGTEECIAPAGSRDAHRRKPTGGHLQGGLQGIYRFSTGVARTGLPTETAHE